MKRMELNDQIPGSPDQIRIVVQEVKFRTFDVAFDEVNRTMRRNETLQVDVFAFFGVAVEERISRNTRVIGDLIRTGREPGRVEKRFAAAATSKSIFQNQLHVSAAVAGHSSMEIREQAAGPFDGENFEGRRWSVEAMEVKTAKGKEADVGAQIHYAERVIRACSVHMKSSADCGVILALNEDLVGYLPIRIAADNGGPREHSDFRLQELPAKEANHRPQFGGKAANEYGRSHPFAEARRVTTLAGRAESSRQLQKEAKTMPAAGSAQSNRMRLPRSTQPPMRARGATYSARGWQRVDGNSEPS